MSNLFFEFEKGVQFPPKVTVKRVLCSKKSYDFVVVDHSKEWIVWYVENVHGYDLMKGYEPHNCTTGRTYFEYALHGDYNTIKDETCKFYYSGAHDFDTITMSFYVIESEQSKDLPRCRRDVENLYVYEYIDDVYYLNKYILKTSACSYKHLRPQFVFSIPKKCFTFYNYG